jgi:hypothetical protein
LSALLSFLVFVIGHFSASLNELASNLGSAFAKGFFYIIYIVLPNLSHFSFIANASHGDFPPSPMILGAIGYAIVYVGILLVITVVIFSRRNFK